LEVQLPQRRSRFLTIFGSFAVLVALVTISGNGSFVATAPPATAPPATVSSPAEGGNASGAGPFVATAPPVTAPPATVSSPAEGGNASGATVATVSPYTKVLLIVEENKSFDKVMGSKAAPYLHSLAAQYGLARNFWAMTPTNVPSLPSYFEMTAGTTFGVTTDCSVSKCSQGGDSIFGQAGAAGIGWRLYAESAHGNCDPADHGYYYARHAPAPYFRAIAVDCRRWDEPFTAFAADLAAGLPGAFTFVTPNGLHDMHDGSVSAGDNWLATWIPQILAGPDYQAGRLAVFITWDEGNLTTNHIPLVVVSPTTSHVSSTTAYNHASLLRAFEEMLGLPLLGDAATAATLRGEFGL
jgi:phospholipase C